MNYIWRSSKIDTSRTYEPSFLRLATASAFVSLFTYAAALCITMACLEQLGAMYKVPSDQLGWPTWALMIGFIISVFPAGRYADKHGKLQPILFGCVLLGVGALMFYYAINFWMLLVAEFVMGVGGAAAESNAIALIGDIYSEKLRASMSNLANVAFGVGAVASPLAISYLIGIRSDWRIGFLIIVAFSIISSVVSLLALLKHGERMHAPEHHAPWHKIINDKLIIVLCITIMLYVSSELGQANWLTIFYANELHTSSTLAARAGSYFWFGIGLGRAVAGLVSRFLSEVRLIRFSLIGAIICQSALLLSYGQCAGIAATIALGFFLGPIFPTIVSYAGSFRPKQTGMVTAIVVAFGALGGAISPPVIGLLSRHFQIRGALWICAIMLSVNLVFYLFMRSNSRPQASV